MPVTATNSRQKMAAETVLAPVVTGSGAALESELSAFHEKMAANYNNAAWELLEQDSLSVGELVRLVLLSSTARYHCRMVGQDEAIAHADVLHGWALARAGAGEEAILILKDALGFFEKSGGEAQEQARELALCHAAMSAACEACGLEELHARHYGEAEVLLAQLDEVSAQVFKSAFATLPLPNTLDESA